MWLYRVTVTADSLRLRIDDRDVLCGFFKNEYLWASSESEAVEAAVGRVRAALAAIQAANQSDVKTASLKIDGVERSVAVWRKLAPEGFVFYRMEEAPSATS